MAILRLSALTIIGVHGGQYNIRTCLAQFCTGSSANFSKAIKLIIMEMYYVDLLANPKNLGLETSVFRV